MTRDSSVLPRKIPKQERSITLVNSIIVATRRILETIEFTQSTTAKIAHLAGVSVGSLYQYFPNKQSLVTAVIEYEVNSHLEVMEEKLRELQSEKIQVAVAALVRLTLESFLKRKKLTKHLSGPTLQFGRVEVLKVGRKKAASLLETFLLLRRAEIQTQDYRLASYVIVSVVMGVVESMMFDEMTQEFTDKLSQETVEIVVLYLRPLP